MSVITRCEPPWSVKDFRRARATRKQQKEGSNGYRFSGLLDRFPRLKFVSVESGIGWIPFMLEACEYQMDQNLLERGGLKLRPREYFQRQIYASYWFEHESTPRTLELLGGDNVMFETDFPHPTCLYPHVCEQVQASLGGLDRSLQRKVLYETAAKVYNLPLPV